MEQIGIKPHKIYRDSQPSVGEPSGQQPVPQLRERQGKYQRAGKKSVTYQSERQSKIQIHSFSGLQTHSGQINNDSYTAV